MTKYEEFLQDHARFCTPEYQDEFKQELDEVIKESLEKFRLHLNSKVLASALNSHVVESYLNQNNVSTNTENPYDLNKFGGLIKNKEE